MAKKSQRRTATPSTQGRPIITGTPVTQIAAQQWQGPLPPPGSLQAFGTIDPSFPDRIVRMAEEAAHHQQTMEREAMRQQDNVLKGDRELKGRGQWFAAALALVFALVGAWLGYLGHPGSGATVITGTVVSLAAIYLVGRQSSNNNGQ